jgi:hypothetical protein
MANQFLNSITVSSGLVTGVTFSAIVSADIPDGGVTYAKIQQSGTPGPLLLGYPTGDTNLATIGVGANLAIGFSTLSVPLVFDGIVRAQSGNFEKANAFVYAESGTLVAVAAMADTDVPVAAVGFAGQTANLQEFRDSSANVLAAVTSNGAFKPASLADASAAKGTVYYSTDASKLVYKDSGGVVNNLY